MRRTSQTAGAAREQQARRTEDAARRALASNILSPNDITGEWDVARALHTTLNGELRPITREDLDAFQKNVKSLGEKLRPGITAKQVVEMSLPEDIDRASKQIRVAIPSGGNKGAIRFITNAGPDSDRARHYVQVELAAFQAAVASPDKPLNVARWLAKTQPLRFDCDCGRHTFWYRYIATIGNFNAGRDETGYPKIRNPRLTGIACKHVLRVMAELQSSSFVHGFIAKMIEKARTRQSRQAVRVGKDEAAKQAAKQVSKPRAIGASVSKKLAASLKSKSPAKAGALARLPAAPMSPEMALKAFMEQTGMQASDIMALLKAEGK